MKAVYIQTTTIEINLTNGETIVQKDYTPSGFIRYVYRYGEVPNETITEYNNPNNIFETLASFLSLSIHRTLFRKRQYIYDYCLGESDFGKRMYKDEVKSFVIKNNYEIIVKPSIDKLQSDLDFYTYSQLVFDRERELKGMLNKGD